MLSYALGFFSGSCHSIVVSLLVGTLLAFFMLLRQKENNSVQNDEVCSACDEKMSRPVGPLEKGLLATEEKRRNTLVVGCVFLKSKVPLVPEMLKEALILLAKRYPLLRMKTTTESQNGDPIIEHFTEVDDPSNVNFKVLKDFSADQFIPVFEREAEVPFDFNLGPLWRAILLKEIHIVEEDLFKNTLVLAFHHVISDGRSALLIQDQLLSYLSLLYDGQNVTVESMPFRPSTGYLMRHCCTPSLFDKVVYGVNSIMQRLNTIFTTPSRKHENLYLASYPPVFTRIPSAANKTSVVYREFSSDETSALIKKCKVIKCSVHGAITAAAHIAMARILQKGNEIAPKDSLCLKSSCNVDLRKECRPEIKPEEFALCVSSFRTEINVPPHLKDFWKFARECTEQVRLSFDTKQHHKFLKQCHLNISKGTRQSTAATARQQDPRLFNLSNMGRCKWSEEQSGPYRAAGAAFIVALPGPVFALIFTTVNGTMYWTNSYNTRLVTREQAVEFLDLTLEIMKDACNA